MALVFTGSVEAKMPLGMNLPGITYYDTSLLFVDAMKTANLRANATDISDLSGTKFSLFPKDSDGYPTTVPYTINGHSYEYIALINSYYTGEYVLLYDGEGSVSINGGVVSQSVVDGNIHFIMPGSLSNIWVRVASVTAGNHVRNIRVIPIEYLGNEINMPTFRSDYLAGLSPFTTLRFMDVVRANDSVAREWSGRVKKTSISQGTATGAAWEYVVQMANQLDKNPWINIPREASDDYITQLASLLKSTLEPGRVLYLEYSNELWNWSMPQATYVASSAPNHPNSYVTQDLAQLSSKISVTASGNTFSGATLANGNPVMFTASGSLPSPLQAYTQYFVVNASGATFQVAETVGGTAITLSTTGSGVLVHKGDNYLVKDAYMAARVFRLFSSVFVGEMESRVVRVVGGQASWAGNTGSLLNYLFNTDGIGADALAVGGYFSFNPADHTTWLAMDQDTVTPEMVLQSAERFYAANTATWARDSAVYAKLYGVDYLVYEGGQHMMPYQQGEWAYNHAIYDAQIHPGMYDLFMTNFATHAAPNVDCKLFVVFAYVGPRENKYGSWGVLENLAQLDSPSTLMITAPKYQALLDWNKSSRRIFRNVRVGEVEP